VLSLLEAEFVVLGYEIIAQIVTWPDMMPGDVGLILSWDCTEA